MGMSPDNRSTAAITRMGLLAALAALSPATGVATAGMSRVVGIASAAELIDAVEQAQPGDLIEVASVSAGDAHSCDPDGAHLRPSITTAARSPVRPDAVTSTRCARPVRTSVAAIATSVRPWAAPNHPSLVRLL